MVPEYPSSLMKIKRVSLSVQLKYDGVLVIGGSSPEFLHVDSRDTCCDQEGLIKKSDRENIQSNLKCGFLRIECGTQSVVATSNL
ncbi:hypothetical protein Tco_1084688 [Tanacetum coccineum]